MKMTWGSLKAGVIGAGKSGLAAAALLKRLGAHVLLSESKNERPKTIRGVDVETGGHSDRLLECDLLIRSPGVPGHLPILVKAHCRHIPIWSELELGASLLPKVTIAAITGTNGKTTTTTLVGKIFADAGRKTFVGGNIGTPLSTHALRIKRGTTVTLEVSSYQLEDIHAFHPTISAILNITPDHLEHHGTMRAYVDAKARIFENQTARDVCVLNADDALCRKLARRCRARILYFSRRRKLAEGIYFTDGQIHLNWDHQHLSWPLRWPLPGAHNIENALAAAAVGIAGGVHWKSIQKTLDRFPGVEHRLEVVRDLREVRYINDSKATNVDSTRVALEAFERPLLLIAGGRGKGTPYTSLEGLVRRHVKQLLLIGEDAVKIEKDLGQAAPVESVGTMEKAVALAQKLANPGDIVLLSPACASFDQYNNYEERGRHFKNLVRALR